jgi:hypothetical protein
MRREKAGRQHERCDAPGLPTGTRPSINMRTLAVGCVDAPTNVAAQVSSRTLAFASSTMTVRITAFNAAGGSERR